jgi:hypothetical protein
MQRRLQRVHLWAPFFVLAGCGGGGGGSNGDAPPVPVPPTLTFNAQSLSIFSGESTTLAWSSTGATSCTASDS